MVKITEKQYYKKNDTKRWFYIDKEHYTRALVLFLDKIDQHYVDIVLTMCG